MSIKQEKNGTWTVKFYYGFDYVKGKKVEITRRGLTFDEAKLVEAKLKQEKLEGKLPPSQKPFKKFLEEWIKTKEQKVKGTTWRQYQSYLNNYIKPIEHLKLAQIHARDIENLFYQLRTNGRFDKKKGKISETTLLHFWRFLYQIFEYAMKMEYITKNPMIKVEKPKQEDFQAEIYDEDEINKLIAYAKNEENGNIYKILAVLILTGARYGEVMALKWNDINFKKMTIRIDEAVNEIKKSKSKTGMCWQFDSVKSTDSYRTIAMQKDLAEILLKIKEKNNEEINTYNLIFYTEDGNPWLHGNFTKFKKEALKKVGLKEIRTHDFRHSHASLLVESGVSFASVKKHMGHANISTTLAVYTHAYPLSEDEIRDIFDKK